MIFGILAWIISLQYPFRKPLDEKQRHKVQALIDALNSHSNMLDNGKLEVAIPLKCGLKHTY